jgi:hypothetical protein
MPIFCCCCRSELTRAYVKVLEEVPSIALSAEPSSLLKKIGTRIAPVYDNSSRPIKLYVQVFDVMLGAQHWNLLAVDRYGISHVWEVANPGRPLAGPEPLVVEKLDEGMKTRMHRLGSSSFARFLNETPEGGLEASLSVTEMDVFLKDYAKGKNYHMHKNNCWNCQRFTAEALWWATGSLDRIPQPQSNQDPTNMAPDPWGRDKPNKGSDKGDCLVM